MIRGRRTADRIITAEVVATAPRAFATAYRFQIDWDRGGTLWRQVGIRIWRDEVSAQRDLTKELLRLIRA